jgi:hypothetical protein
LDQLGAQLGAQLASSSAASSASCGMSRGRTSRTLRRLRMSADIAAASAALTS